MQRSTTPRGRRALKAFVLIVIAPFVILSVLPYALPLPNASAPLSERPFENSLQTDVDSVGVHAQAWPAVADDAVSPACAFLLLHGFAGSTFSWRLLAPMLARRGHAVLAVDLPPFGYSARQALPDGDGVALWKAVEQIRPGARWCVIGHSMGARAAAEFVAKQPARIDAAIYIGGTPFARAERGWRGPVVRALVAYPPVQRWIAVYADRTQLNDQRFSALLQSAYGRAPTAVEVLGYLEPMRVAGTAPAIIARMARPVAVIDESTLDDIPTLLLWGAVDTWVPPEVAERVRERMPHAPLSQLAGAAHSPMETHSDETFRRIDAWLDSTGAGQPAARGQRAD